MTVRRLVPTSARPRSASPPLPCPPPRPSCPDWVARTVSVQGRVETRRAGEPAVAARYGSRPRTAPATPSGSGRSAARPSPCATARVLRLDQNTTITFTPPAERATYVDRPPDRRRPLLQPDPARAPHHDAVRQRVGRGNRVPGRGGRRPRRASPCGRAGSSRRTRRVPSTSTAGQSAAARAGQPPDAPADRRETHRRRRLGALLSPRPRPSPGRLPRPAGRDVAAAGPPLHRGSRPRRPRGRAGQRRGHSGLRQRPAGVRAPGRAAPRRGTSGRGAARHRPGARLAPQPGDALALRSVVAVAKNDRAARARAGRAGRPGRPGIGRRPPRALLRPAGGLRPPRGARERPARRCSSSRDNALAHARLAELWLSLGDLDRAREAATEAARLDPGERARPDGARLHRPDPDPAARGRRGLRARDRSSIRRRPCRGSGSA